MVSAGAGIWTQAALPDHDMSARTGLPRLRRGVRWCSPSSQRPRMLRVPSAVLRVGAGEGPLFSVRSL